MPKDENQTKSTRVVSQPTRSSYSVSSSFAGSVFSFSRFPLRLTMDVLVGSTFAIDVSSSPPPSYGGEHPCGDAEERAVSFSPFGDGFSAGESSEASSSIGTPDDSSSDENDVVSPKRDREEEEEEEEVQSQFKGLDSLDSLEDSLPIKRGLSSHFIGKSKSFSDLSQVTTVKELQKQENPFNKKRRILIATKRARRSSFYSWTNPQSMPLLPVVEDEYECETEKATKVSPSSSSSSTEEKEENPIIDQVLLRQQNRVPRSYSAHMRLRLGSLKSRSFSLADLQEHEEEEEEEEEEDDNEHLG